MGGFTKILLLLALVLIGGVAALQFGLVGGAEEVRTRGVRVAEAPLSVGTFLDDADAPFQQRPETSVKEEWVTETGADVVGAVVIAPVAAGDPVPRAALLLPGQEGFLAAVLTPGARAVSIAVDAVSGNAGHIFPGDRVDLILTQRIEDSVSGEDPAKAWASETILRNVRVIAVDQKLAEDLAARAPDSVARTITLEVSPADAERIAVARNLGALSLTLRSLILENRDGDAMEVAEDAPTGPTWAGDISSATRSAIGRPAPEDPEPSPVVQRPIVVFHGSTAVEVQK